MSALREVHRTLKMSVGIEPQALNGTNDLVGEIIDTIEFDSLEFVLLTDAIAVGDLDAQLKLEEGDDAGLSDASDVTDTDDLAGLPADTAIDETDDKVTKKIGYLGNKRFVRATLVVSTNAGTDVMSCLAIQGHAHAAPVA